MDRSYKFNDGRDNKGKLLSPGAIVCSIFTRALIDYCKQQAITPCKSSSLATGKDSKIH